MSTRLNSIISFIVLILVIAIIFHPSRGGEVVVTREGYAHFSINNASVLQLNESFNSTTVLNDGEGHLILSVKILSISRTLCHNASAIRILMNITAMGNIPDNMVPKDALFAVYGTNGTMFYGFIMNNNSGVNATPWPAEASMNAPEAWSPKSIYDGFKPNSSNFTISTHLLWMVVPASNEGLRISVRLYGFKSRVESIVNFVFEEGG